MAFGWDPAKAEANFRKHRVRFATEAVAALSDVYGITISDDESDPAEQRFVALARGGLGRILVVVYAYRGEDIRIISARPAEPHEREQYEAQL